MLQGLVKFEDFISELHVFGLEFHHELRHVLEFAYQTLLAHLYFLKLTIEVLDGLVELLDLTIFVVEFMLGLFDSFFQFIERKFVIGFRRRGQNLDIGQLELIFGESLRELLYFEAKLSDYLLFLIKL